MITIFGNQEGSSIGYNPRYNGRPSLISPLLPTLTAAYKIPTSISGWMVSAYALGYALFALISGPIFLLALGFQKTSTFWLPA